MLEGIELVTLPFETCAAKSFCTAERSEEPLEFADPAPKSEAADPPMVAKWFWRASMACGVSPSEGI
jgi:hypothetical protein